MMNEKPVAIQPVSFQEESLPTGRKLLHVIFKRRYGDFEQTYKWTPQWKGDYGIEKTFFKALEVEEWNDYDGVWSKELKQASKEIPSLDDLRLPVKVRMGELTGPVENKAGVETYRVAVELLSDEQAVWREQDTICIGQVQIPWKSFSTFLLLKGRSVCGVSKGIETVQEWVGDEPSSDRSFVHGDWENVGVRFRVWIETVWEKTEYHSIGRELAATIRSFIRKRFADYKALKGGFEEL